MLGINFNGRIRNTEIKKKTELTDVTVKIKTLKWKWAEHVLQIKHDTWIKVVTVYVPRDRKKLR